MMADRADRSRRPVRWPLISAGVIIGMVALTFASVPIYRAVCQQFGFGGTPRIADTDAADTVPPAAQRDMTVRFNADTARGLAWRFRPLQVSMEVDIGVAALAYYQAANMSDRTVTGTATFNVTPLVAAKYFVKTECFCFTEQTLAPGETADMPVSFYVDPAIVDDPALANLSTITLSYTFFEAPSGTAHDAPPVN